jgi:hypothetical protein
MEIAKFVLTAIGTFISVLALSFTVFSYWKKKQEEKDAEFKKGLVESVNLEKTTREKEIAAERAERKQEIEKLENRITYLQDTVIKENGERMSAIEGELKQIRPILASIQNWFINKPAAQRK